MDEKELKKLSRADLLEMLVFVMKENEELRLELNLARSELEERAIRMDQLGSIAEASLELNKVFEAAQKAADQYLYNVNREVERQKQQVTIMVKHCRSLEQETRRKCDEMLHQASENLQAKKEELL